MVVRSKNNFQHGFAHLPPIPRWLNAPKGHVTSKINKNLITWEPVELESCFLAQNAQKVHVYICCNATFFLFATHKSQIAKNYLLAEDGFSNIQKTLVCNKSGVNSMFQVIAMQCIRMFFNVLHTTMSVCTITPCCCSLGQHH